MSMNLVSGPLMVAFRSLTVRHPLNPDLVIISVCQIWLSEERQYDLMRSHSVIFGWQ